MGTIQAETVASPDNDGDLLSILGPSLSKKARQAMAAYFLGRTAYKAASKYYKGKKALSLYSVSLSADDNLWDDVHRWLLDALPPVDQKALQAFSHRDNSSANMKAKRSSYPEAEDCIENTVSHRQQSTGTISLKYDGSRTHSVLMEGHPISVVLTQPESSSNVNNDNFTKWLREKERITFNAKSSLGRDAVTRFLKELSVKHYSEDRKPQFHMLNRWGSWDNRRDIPLRPLQSVVLREGQLERIVGDLQEFLNDAHKYELLGLPYHRGYLFHGCPGSGKTSLAKALSEHFGLDVWYIPLSDIEKDVNLLSLVSSVEPGSILLLEDIDVVSATKDRTDEHGKITMSGLLNALDGFSTPQNLVVILTTNHIEVLDPALIREGRVDVLEEIGYLDQRQLQGLFNMAYGQESPSSLPMITAGAKDISPAEVVGIIKRNFDSPADAHQAVKELIASKDS